MVRMFLTLILACGLLAGCGKAPEPASAPASRLESVRWTAGDSAAVLFASPGGGTLVGTADAGSRWSVLDSLAVDGTQGPRVWLQVRREGITGWVDSGREPSRSEAGKIATH